MRGRDHLGSTTQQSAALHKYPSRPRENARICRRPDGCEMPSLLLATPYGVDAALGASATGVQENPRLACCHAAGCGVTPVTVAGWMPHALTGHDGRDGNDSADAGRA